MARTKRSANLDSRTKRLALESGKQFIETLSDGCYLAYRRPPNGGSGVWTARWYDRGTRTFRQCRLGNADDLLDSNQVTVLTFSEAQVRADAWFKEQAWRAHHLATGEVKSDKPFTVGDALDLYAEDVRRRGRSIDTVEAYSRSRIRPSLGDVAVGKLTTAKIEAWHLALAESPRRKTGQGVSEARDAWASPPTEDQQRARRSTANRILAILKRALNLAYYRGLVGPAAPWRDVRPFASAVGVRDRFLTPQEATALVNAATPEFRPLVLAALYTGSRWSPLCRMLVQDFNSAAGTVYIHGDKGGRSRHVVLDAEGQAFFAAHTAGRPAGDPMFVRDGAVRSAARRGSEHRWLSQDQDWAMACACEAAGITPLTFHSLRHAYASRLVNAGVPLAYVAAQLGHSSTRMVEKHYGHLCPTALSDAVRRLPGQGLAAPVAVEPLATRRA